MLFIPKAYEVLTELDSGQFHTGDMLVVNRYLPKDELVLGRKILDYAALISVLNEMVELLDESGITDGR